MKVKEESEKVGLKFNIQKTKIMASGPILTACQPHSIPAKWMPFFLLNSVPNLSFIQMLLIGGAQMISGAMAARKPEK